MNEQGTLRTEAVERRARAVGRLYNAAYVVLFGSAARGTMKPESDIDLLAILGDGHRSDEPVEEALRADTDLVTTTMARLRTCGERQSSVEYQAWKDGRLIYDRTGRLPPWTTPARAIAPPEPLPEGELMTRRERYEAGESVRFMRRSRESLERLAATGDHDYHMVALHALSAAELALKAWMICAHGEVRRVHDINALRTQARGLGWREPAGLDRRHLERMRLVAKQEPYGSTTRRGLVHPQSFRRHATAIVTSVRDQMLPRWTELGMDVATEEGRLEAEKQDLIRQIDAGEQPAAEQPAADEGQVSRPRSYKLSKNVSSKTDHSQ